MKRCDIKQHVEKKKKVIDIASFILALCIVLYIFDDDIDIGGRRFLRSSSRELSIYLEGPSTLLPWAEHNLIDIKDSTATPQQPPPTALFWEIPRTGARQTKELYQCYNHLTIATADTKDGISRAKGLQLARRTATPEDEEKNTSIHIQIEEEVYPAQQEIIKYSYLEAQQEPPQDPTQDSKALIVSQSAGPQLTGLDGQTIQVNGNKLWELQGATWYNAFTSSRFPLEYGTLPFRHMSIRAEHVQYTEWFTFKEEDPKIPGRMKTRYLSFQMDRRDARKCLFNGSDTCLGGGNFRMNFGKTSPNMINPGVFDVGSVRIVAYNTIPACTRRWYDPAEDINSRQQAGSTKILLENTPVDYARQVQASSVDPKKCGKWIEQRELRDDIFLFNSDLITVHVDTPWMHLIIDVEQNKVATPDECNYATMKVHIANINPGLTKEMQESFGGILSDGDLPIETYQVDGPFSTEYIPIPEPDTAVEEEDSGIIDEQVPTSGTVEGLDDKMLGFVA